MALTRDFKETIQARIERDPAFREELLKEGVECLISGDMDTGKAVLRDYINATIGFEELGSLTESRQNQLGEMILDIVAQDHSDEQLTPDQQEEVRRRLCDPNPKFATEEQTEAAFGKFSKA